MFLTGNSQDYDTVARRMLTVDSSRPGAALWYSVNGLEKPAVHSTRMISRQDSSFVRQLHQVLHPAFGLGLTQDTPPPDLYLLTAHSAKPLSTALRTFYDSMGLATPTIGSIEDGDNEAFIANKQVERKVQGAQHVCIIDQMVLSGLTLLRSARSVARTADATTVVSGIRGTWYDDARRYADDPTTPTVSDHAGFFRGVGAAAAKLYIDFTSTYNPAMDTPLSMRTADLLRE
ncbi:hypothetical protein KDA14_02925 [Candidatus Saccharibacteria bacterium]|nr:hypothetical protein [Candidatus Saccharibacteria bacterium]